MSRVYVHRQLCAAHVNGCRSFLRWESDNVSTNTHFLELNGWKLDHGQWICPNHEERR